jgi:hypothetical protein
VRSGPVQPLHRVVASVVAIISIDVAVEPHKAQLPVVAPTHAVETEMHIDREICKRRVQRAQMNVTRALALPQEQHKKEHK